MDYCTCKITPGTSAYGGSRIDSRGCEKHDTRDEIIDQLRQERDNSLRYTELLITERDTLRAEAARLQEALDPIARAYQVSMKPFAPGIDEADGAQHWMPHGWPSVADFKAAAAALSSTTTTAEWLAARDAEQRRIGAAEWLEKEAAENLERFGTHFYESTTDSMLAEAARLRRGE